MLKAIIVDDVENARISLKEDLKAYCSDVQVIGEADGVVSAARLLKKFQPDILFLDIQMQDGSGFDLLDILSEIKFKIIFTTASDAFAIQAFRFSALDYLLKPIDPDELVEAVHKANEQPASQGEHFELLLETVKDQQQLPKRISLHTQDKIHIVAVDDIVRCESNDNYTLFYLADGKKLLVTRTLKEFDQMLTDIIFIVFISPTW